MTALTNWPTTAQKAREKLAITNLNDDNFIEQHTAELDKRPLPKRRKEALRLAIDGLKKKKQEILCEQVDESTLRTLEAGRKRTQKCRALKESLLKKRYTLPR